MSPTFYYILHVFSVLTLTGYTFYAFSGPATETRRKVMIITGIANLIILISGVGLLHKLHGGFENMPSWVYVKFAAWLVLSALAGMAYRRRSILGVLQLIALVAIFAALYAVYTKLA